VVAFRDWKEVRNIHGNSMIANSNPGMYAGATYSRGNGVFAVGDDLRDSSGNYASFGFCSKAGQTGFLQYNQCIGKSAGFPNLSSLVANIAISPSAGNGQWNYDNGTTASVQGTGLAAGAGAWPSSYVVWASAYPGGCNVGGTGYPYCALVSAGNDLTSPTLEMGVFTSSDLGTWTLRHTGSNSDYSYWANGQLSLQGTSWSNLGSYTQPDFGDFLTYNGSTYLTFAVGGSTAALTQTLLYQMNNVGQSAGDNALASNFTLIGWDLPRYMIPWAPAPTFSIVDNKHFVGRHNFGEELETVYASSGGDQYIAYAIFQDITQTHFVLDGWNGAYAAPSGSKFTGGVVQGAGQLATGAAYDPVYCQTAACTSYFNIIGNNEVYEDKHNNKLNYWINGYVSVERQGVDW
jgi:hypothetical protein